MSSFELIKQSLLSIGFKCPYCNSLYSTSKGGSRIHPTYPDSYCQNVIHINIWDHLIRFYGNNIGTDYDLNSFDIRINDCNFNSIEDIFKYFELIQFYR